MKNWLLRNTVPIAWVLLASVVVIGGFELIESFAGSGSPATESDDVELTGIASLAGLVKVSLFLGVGALIAVPLKRRMRPSPESEGR